MVNEQEAEVRVINTSSVNLQRAAWVSHGVLGTGRHLHVLVMHICHLTGPSSGLASLIHYAHPSFYYLGAMTTSSVRVCCAMQGLHVRPTTSHSYMGKN